LRKRRRRVSTASSAGDFDELLISCNETAKERGSGAKDTVVKVCARTDDDWRNVIVGRDANNHCTKLKIFEI
jgi:hypothetical protein